MGLGYGHNIVSSVSTKKLFLKIYLQTSKHIRSLRIYQYRLPRIVRVTVIRSIRSNNIFLVFSRTLVLYCTVCTTVLHCRTQDTKPRCPLTVTRWRKLSQELGHHIVFQEKKLI